MNFNRPRLFSAAAGVMLMLAAGFGTVAHAQEFSESHLSAARKAISATRATATFDNILFNASAGLKNQLTAKSPDKVDEISNVVDEEALALAPRRGDLEGEAARLFANTFSEAELNEIATFFASETGSKYLGATPVLARELGKSARVWANGISRDLAANVAKRLEPAAN
ncbi:MAG: DUF2059 domain-containing protein [Pseudomonadota bacterium]